MEAERKKSVEEILSEHHIMVEPDDDEAIMYEVMIPKKIHYFSIIEDVLETLFDVERIKELPNIKFLMRDCKNDFQKAIPEFLVSFSEVFSGYSMYEVDGRFVDRTKDVKAKDRKVDERVIVIRFYFVKPPHKDIEIYRSQVATVFHAFIGERLFFLLPDEKEIWVTETVVPTIKIYRRT